MLRVIKPTSPLSVGSWILSPFSALAAVAAGSEVTGWFPRLGRLAGAGAGVLGPAMCTYTAVLLADTATPAWHEGYRELPILFAGSALTSGAGAALVAAPPGRQGRRCGLDLSGRLRNWPRVRNWSAGSASCPSHTARAGRASC
jgi:hypothetical protein